MTQASPLLDATPASNSTKEKSARKNKISYSSAPRHDIIKDLTNNPKRMEEVRKRILQKEKDKALAKLKVNLEDAAFHVKCPVSDRGADLGGDCHDGIGQEMTEEGCSSLRRSESTESVSSTLSSTPSSSLSHSSLADNDEQASGLSKRSTLEALDGEGREGEDQASLLANICSLLSSAFWKPRGIPKRVPLIHEHYTPLVDSECRHDIAPSTHNAAASAVLPFVTSPSKQPRDNRTLSLSPSAA
jgi:hypothetical protein